MSENLRKTPLYDNHKKLGAKLVEFGGWEMPISYEGVIAEHHTVRNSCGIFDVSHMGEVFVEGKEADAFMQWLTINDVSRLQKGQGQYSAMLNKQGGMIDDLIIYRLEKDRFLLCVNASNTDKDFQWISENATRFDVKVSNESAKWSQIAVQGPNSREAVEAILNSQEISQIAKLEYMEILPCSLKGQSALIARTGYTGEHGYEIYLPNQVAPQVWDSLLATAQKTGIKPIGLGARDTLRLEACYLLYGNDMDDAVTPIEAGISWAVRMEKDFIGKNVLEKQKAGGAPRKMVAFLLEDKGIARHGMDVYVGAKNIGKVTSASFLPTLDKAGGMALIATDGGKVGDTIEIDIRGKRKLAKIVKRPLYSARVK